MSLVRSGGAASFAALLVLAGCSGTKIPNGSESATDGGTSTSGGSNGAGNGNGEGGSGGEVDGGSGAGGACPCALESYCDLATNTCKSGCTDESQCKPGRSCDLANRVCKDKCSGAACVAQSCPAPAPGAGQTCNGITPDGAEINVTCKTGLGPAPKGGSITGGAYVLTAVELYRTTGCTPGTARAQLYICGATWSFAFDQGTAAVNAATTTATVASPTTYSLAQTCPAGLGSPQIMGFDATATTLTLYTGSADTAEVDHYTLR